jgi:hypothetical protein
MYSLSVLFLAGTMTATGLEAADSPTANVRISLNETSILINPGDTVKLAVVVNATLGDPETEIDGAQFTLRYNTTLFNATMIKNGSFLGSSSIVVIQRINNSMGTIDFAAFRIDTDNGSTGSGILAYLTLAVKSNAPPATTMLTFSEVILVEAPDSAIATHIENSSVTINARPVASFAYTPTAPMETQEVVFDAGYSYDPDGVLSTITWTFGDGTSTTGIQATHTYSTSGTYHIILSITDNQGAITTAIQTITVTAFNQPPQAPVSPTPPDGAPAMSPDTVLTWTCIDPDEDTLTYDVYLGTTTTPSKVAMNISSPSYTPALEASNTYYWSVQVWDEHGAHNMSDQWQFTTQTPTHHAVVTQLQPASGGTVTLTPPGGAYPRGTSVEVTAQPASGYSFHHWSGDVAGTTKSIQVTVTTNMTITAHFIQQNQPPTVAIHSVSSNVTWEGIIHVEGTATDSDGSISAVGVRVDSGPWQPASGTISWHAVLNLSMLSPGNYTLYARSYDGTHYSTLASYPLTIGADDDNKLPPVAITAPVNGTTVSGTVNITGTGHDSDANLLVVQIKIDSAEWINVSGTHAWHYLWNTTSIADGSHTIKARSYNGQTYSDSISVEVTVADQGDEATPGFTLFLIGAAVAITLMLSRKHRCSSSRP